MGAGGGGQPDAGVVDGAGDSDRGRDWILAGAHLKRKTLRRFDLRGAGRHFGDARLSGACRMSRGYIYPGLFDVVLILLLMLQVLLGVCGDDDPTDEWVGMWTLKTRNKKRH